MVLLCGFHHRLFHHDEWTVRIPPETGIPEFIPPRWIDPTQTPRSKPWRARLAALNAINRELA
jgi:5-methylcytosine-specific restriction protein A